MKVVQINATCGVGSTGKICAAISELLTEREIENYILHSGNTNGYDLGIACADSKYTKIQAGKSRIFGNYGFNSKKETKRIICELEKIQPDIVHLHNIHGHDCNLEILFQYFKKKRTKLLWTFHDCWAFTGYCSYFSYPECTQWKIKCNHCPQRKQFSWFVDLSSKLFDKKKKLFTGLDLTIVTPSQWLADLVKQSFLSQYPIKVINNGVDLSVFQPTSGVFRQKNGIGDQYIVLGVAFDWGVRKGLDVFIALAHRLPVEQYQIVLVGTDERIDQQLPSNVISVHRTQNQAELAEIYTVADVFVNPTREENYPTVNMEALACGTPVITFRTGGSPEIIDDTCGIVIDCNDLQGMEDAIICVCEQQSFVETQCMKRAKRFDCSKRFAEYIRLYDGISDKAIMEKYRKERLHGGTISTGTEEY